MPDRSGDRHKNNPLSIRLPDAERERLNEYAEQSGVPVRRFIIEAVREKLDRADAPAGNGETREPS